MIGTWLGYAFGLLCLFLVINMFAALRDALHSWGWQGYLAAGQKAAWILGGLTFIGAYVYCVATYGFLLGMGLGWLPSAILAFIIGVVAQFLWLPMMVIAVVVLLHFWAQMTGLEEEVLNAARDSWPKLSSGLAMTVTALLVCSVAAAFVAIVRNFRRRSE